MIRILYIIVFAFVLTFNCLHLNAEPFPVEFGKKYGYLDENLKIKQKPVYDFASDFVDGIAVVRFDNQFLIVDEDFNIKSKIVAENCYKPNCGHILCYADHKWFFVDYNGKLVSDLFEQAYSFIDEYATVKKDGAYYFLTKNNELLPAPAGYSYNSSPEENLVNVNDNNNIKSKKTHYGIIDIHGKVIIPLDYSAMSSFHDGICAVEIRYSNNERKWRFINQKGEYISESIFSATKPFVKGFTCVRKTDCWYIIDKKGNEIFEFPSSVNIDSKFSKNGICIYSEIVGSFLKYGYVSNSGKKITDAVFQNCFSFNGKYAQAVLDGKNVIVDEFGKIYNVKELFEMEEDVPAIMWG